MWEILIIFCLGLLTGIVFKNRWSIQKEVGILIEWTIYLLLFFLGITVGLNKAIINNMGTIGFYGILISLIAVFFSVLISGIVYSYFFKKRDEK
jgi:uncharacterized membrane protein YbjE (DUF340 family)